MSACAEPGLRRLIPEIQKNGRRVILLTPVAMPGFKVPGYDAWLSQCQATVSRVGSDLDLPVIDIEWVPDEAELTERLQNPRKAMAWMREQTLALGQRAG